MLVEFRHRSWLDDENRAASLAFLERIGAGYVVVDAPRSDTAKNLVPTVVATTSPTAYVRFHGRNLATWNKRGGSAAERFDYLYSDEELGEWVEPLRELAGAVGAGVRLLQQQRLVGGSRQPARPRLAGRDERAAAAAAARREPDRRERRSVGWRVNVLSIVHGEDAGPELFGPLVAEAGHRLDEWSFERGTPPPPLDAYDAVLVFGGFMHPDQDDLYPWLPEETDWLRGLVERRMPTLGICLGSRAPRAGDGRVGRAAPRARDRLGRGRADGGRRRGSGLLGAARAVRRR